MKYQKEGPRLMVSRFGSLSEMMDFATNRENCSKENLNRWDGYRTIKKEWTNNYSVDRVQNELASPPACSAEVSKITDAITAAHELEVYGGRRMAYRRDDGDELDPVAWIRRDVEGWNRMERVNKTRKVIRIAVNPSVSCYRKPQDIYFRGAAAAALADALESAGHSVEIVLIESSNSVLMNDGNKDVSVIETVIKRADMPLEKGAVFLSLGEIGFFRTAMLLTGITCANELISSGLGRPHPIPEKMADDYDVVLDQDITNKAKALAAVNKYAAEFNA